MIKIKLRNKDYCDGCIKLENLNTLGGHRKCLIYKRVMLAQEDMFIASKGVGYFPRLKKCKDENVVEIHK